MYYSNIQYIIHFLPVHIHSCCHIFLLVFVPICIGHFAWGVRTGGWFPFSGGLRGGQHRKTAKVTLIQAADSGVSGQLFLSQSHPNGPVLVRGLINGLKKGYHGFHVHMKGQLGNDCKDSGSHFNPFMVWQCDKKRLKREQKFDLLLILFFLIQTPETNSTNVILEGLEEQKWVAKIEIWHYLQF